MFNLDKDIQITTNLLGLSFIVTAEQFISSLQASVIQLPQLAPVFKRERASHLYTSSAYYIANVASVIFTLWIQPLCSGAVSFYFFELEANSFADLLYYLIGLYCICLCGRMLGLAVGAAVTDPLKSLQIAGLCSMIFVDTGGCFANVGENASWIIKTLSYVSPVRYSIEIQMRRLTEGRQVQDQIL